MKNLDGKARDCYILDEYSHNEIVPFEPAEYWYLSLYIITLDDVDGAFSSSKQKYLVLEYPSYTEINTSNEINDCIWSVPYTEYLLQKPGTRRFSNIGAIMRFYEEQLSSHRTLIQELENYRFYHMGISDYLKIEGNHYIEYKISTRQPDKWKCYYIQEHYITRIDSLGLRNLADPESLHSYRYFPLVPQPFINEGPFYFAGKHLASNIKHLLQTSYYKLLQYSNPVPGEMLRYRINGIVVKIDIIGFTAMYNKITNEMKSLDEDGKEIAVHFIAGLSNIFESRMQEFGIPQFVIEGDGLTGTLPLKSSEISNGVISIIKCVHQIRQDINVLAAKLGENICLRCSIIAGEYFYGKLAGLSSSKQASGEILISLSRMDQFLQDCVKKDPILATKSIVLCINNHLYNECQDFLINLGFVELTTQSTFRETSINSTALYKEA